MRLGRVEINYGYVVDLDSEEMVEQAKLCLFEDIINFYKYDEIADHIGIRPNQVTEYSTTFSEDDIPDFLMEDDHRRKLESGEIECEHPTRKRVEDE